MRRAYRPEEKEARRQKILAVALVMLREVPYSELRMVDLAQRVMLGKGTLYLYFPNKESLFLALLQEELGAWFERASVRLEAMPVGHDPVAVAETLVQELAAHPLLPGLQALLHGVLERNLPPAEAYALAQFLQAGVERVGHDLERVLPALEPGQGPLYLIRFHGLVIACQQLSARPPVLRTVLEDPKLALFAFQFEDLMRGSAVDLLLGMLARSRR